MFQLPAFRRLHSAKICLLWKRKGTLPRNLTEMLSSSISRSYSTALRGRKKFYNTVTISQENGNYEVNLDGRKLKAPSGDIMKLPNDVLANAVALEWDSQKDILKYHTMPITNLCFYAIDKPNGDEKSTLVDICLNFLNTDTILFHSEEPPGLAERQKDWVRIIDWAKERHHVEISCTKSFFPPAIPKETEDVFERLLLSYNFWALTGFERLVHTLKSLLLTVALVERHVTVEEAVSLSRLETEFQISKWGNVEWHHDIELLETRAKAAACAMFIHACSEDSRYIAMRETG